MTRLEAKNHDNFTYIIPLFCLLLVNTMTRSTSDTLINIGDISINLTLILSAAFLIRQIYYNDVPRLNLMYVYLALGLFTIIHITHVLTGDSFSGGGLTQLLLFFVFILWAIRTRWTPEHVKTIAYLLGIMTLFFIVNWVVEDFTTNLFQSIYRNQNYLAVLLFVMFYFKIIALKYGRAMERVYFSLLMTADFSMMIATNARSVLIAMLVIIVAWIFLKLYPRIFSGLLYLVLAFNILFMLVYTMLHNTALGDTLNQISVSLFNKNLFSGRAELWSQIYDAVAQKPIFGYGPGIKASDVISMDLTAHNQYLQMLLEGGLIGLAIFLLLIIAIWKLLLVNIDQFAARLSACFFLGILVYESFELTLFQNNYSIAMLQWLIITIGVAFHYSSDKKPETPRF